MYTRYFTALAILVALGFSACSTAPPAVTPGAQRLFTGQRSGKYSNADCESGSERKKPLPAGTILRVRLYNAIDTGRTRNGDSFIASLSAPITVDERTILPKGTIVHGTSGRHHRRAA